MGGVLLAEGTVFAQGDFVRGVLFVLHGVVVSLLAFVASERDFYSHNGASFDVGILRDTSASLLGRVRFGVRDAGPPQNAKKKKPFYR